MNSVKFIEVEASDIEKFNNTNWDDSDVIQINLTIDGKRALQYNKTGEYGYFIIGMDNDSKLIVV